MSGGQDEAAEMIETSGSGLETEAQRIENAAADIAYRSGLGVSAWDMFLSHEQSQRLKELAQLGFGTWGRELKLANERKNNPTVGG